MERRNVFQNNDPDDPIVAVGLLTQGDLNLLGSGFRRAFHIDDDSAAFDELLAAIDAADTRNISSQ